MADATSEQPNPGRIYDLFTGVFRPQIVRLALQPDVFTPLAGGPAEAAHLLDVLTGMGVLTRSDGLYALAPGAATFLLSGRPAYTADLILAWAGPAIWARVANAVRTGDIAPFEEYHEQDAWLESYSEWRLADSLAMWRTAGVEVQAMESHPDSHADLSQSCAPPRSRSACAYWNWASVRAT